MRNTLNFFATLFGRAIPKIDMVQKCTKMCDKNWWQTASVETINTTINSADLGAYCEHGATPLHFAAWWGTSENIATLLKAGADVGVLTEYGETPLHFAAGVGTPENIATLLKADADMNVRNEIGWTPLHFAAGEGTSENVSTLLKAGVDVEVHVDEYGETPLHFAAGLGAPESVTLLLKAGANGSLKDKDGNTPFDLAKGNSKMKGTDAYWLLNDARYK